jgi:hypothetical protein
MGVRIEPEGNGVDPDAGSVPQSHGLGGLDDPGVAGAAVRITFAPSSRRRIWILTARRMALVAG